MCLLERDRIMFLFGCRLREILDIGVTICEFGDNVAPVKKSYPDTLLLILVHIDVLIFYIV